MPLCIVSTPIGNLGDMTYRAVETLKGADMVVAEDTRTAKKLFAAYEIRTPCVSYHGHSTERDEEKILALLKAGKQVALVSEAGTPGISDPGYRLVVRAVEAGVTVTPIPGVSACIAALSASGLHTHAFRYIGFLPLKKGRKGVIEGLRGERDTVVLYESVHRVGRLLGDMADALGGERRVVVAREMTKLHEEFFRGTLREACAWAGGKTMKGEFVIVLGGCATIEA